MSFRRDLEKMSKRCEADADADAANWRDNVGQSTEDAEKTGFLEGYATAVNDVLGMYLSSLKSDKDPDQIDMRHASIDAILYGQGYLIDGYHVATPRVTIIPRDGVSEEFVEHIAERLTTLLKGDT